MTLSRRVDDDLRILTLIGVSTNSTIQPVGRVRSLPLSEAAFLCVNVLTGKLHVAFSFCP